MGRALGPDSPPTMTQPIPSKSRSGSLEDKRAKIRLRGDLNKFEPVEEDETRWDFWEDL